MTTPPERPTTTDAGIPVASDEHSLTIGPDGPIVKHFISVNKELLGGKRADPCPPPPSGHGYPVRQETMNAERVV